MLECCVQQAEHKAVGACIEGIRLDWKARIVDKSDNVADFLAPGVNEYRRLYRHAQALTQALLADDLLRRLDRPAEI